MVIMAEEKIYVINNRGEREPFSFRKVYNSCRRIGASKGLARDIAEQIRSEVYPGIETSEIFNSVKQRLIGTSFRSGIKFSLKDAMRKLGPSGFDFEKYVGEVFTRNGFEVEMNQLIPGFCIGSYEIDFVAKKGGVVHLAECKYHHQAGNRVDLKVGLISYARFLDIKKGTYFKRQKVRPLIVTNVKFTSEVKRYARCTDIDLLGWKFPPRRGLEKMIEKQNLYPITILPSFKRYFKEIFARERIMMARDILEFSTKSLASRLKISPREIEKLREEAGLLLE